MLHNSTFVQNLTVRKKLLTGFGLVLLILLLISVLSYNALQSLTARFQLVADVSETNLLISEARQQEKNFMLRNDSQYYERAIAITNQAKQLGEKSLAQFTTQESAALMNELLRNVELYQQQLQQLSSVDMVNNRTETLAIEERMTSVARAADEAGTKSVANQLFMLEAEANSLERIIIIAAALAIAIGIAAAIVITQMVVTPLQQVVSVAEKIAAGDLTNDLPTNRLDEPGQLMAAMQRMSISLRNLIQNLTAGIAQLATATEEMAAISEQNAAGVNQQKEETEQVATAMNEMSATVQEVAKSAEDASGAATESAQQASMGEQVVEKTMQQIKALAHEVATSAKAISELKEQSNNIGSVLDVIKSIADQTNLLALNAAIEAARAGEAGRGFSVVAEEVRALAFRTQESTGQIEQLISTLQQKAEDAVSNMHKSSGLAENTLASADDAGDAIKAISEAVNSIQQMNQQIAAAALQQSTVAEQINRSIYSIRDVAEQSATASEQTAEASTDLSRLGTELQQLAAQFKVA
ncbi:methyl-accepting chemotaxis protein [Rheinheimera fenheensis]|jgi:methyl-accepting chemotaxis protein|uniref:methyl-accepting chemotaxis protein n=1 Tax=Rheinheimera fenheensis TaxID=3152295 RepID=UPI00325F49D2